MAASAGNGFVAFEGWWAGSYQALCGPRVRSKSFQPSHSYLRAARGGTCVFDPGWFRRPALSNARCG